MRRRDEFDPSKIIEKYAEYEAVRSTFGEWVALLFLKLPVLVGTIFAVYMLHAYYSGSLHNDFQPTPEQRAKLETMGIFYGEDGSPLTCQWDENGHLEWAKDRWNRVYHMGPDGHVVLDR